VAKELLARQLDLVRGSGDVISSTISYDTYGVKLLVVPAGYARRSHSRVEIGGTVSNCAPAVN
jgi:hypothetical protein